MIWEKTGNRTNLGSVISSLLAENSNVVVKQKINSTNFTLSKKVFAFTKGGGVVLKLPQDTVKRLMKSKSALPLVMGERVMKEWVVLHHETPNDFKKNLDLFRESMEFVSSGAGKR